MVRSWRAAWFVLVFAALAGPPGCTVERATGEFGAGACGDVADNDDDGMSDCADPDCQAEAICGRPAPLRGPREPEPKPTAGSLAPPPPQTDAGTTRPPPMSANDAQVSEPVPMAPEPEPPLDATAPEPRQCPVCAADERCIAGYCVPNEAVFVELWDVTSISVVMPRGTSPSMCVDPFCLISEMSSGPAAFSTCRCAPDPYVRIQVQRPGEAPETVVTTAYRGDVDEATWDERRQLQLRPDYQLIVQAVDRDGVTSNSVVFECTFPADPDLLGSGVLECMQTFQGSAAFAASLRVELEAAATPVAMP
jgi:hypothetical protein